MKTQSAVRKLEKAGYVIKTNGSFYIAKNDEKIIEFIDRCGTVSRFAAMDPTACAPTYGLSLKNAMGV